MAVEPAKAHVRQPVQSGDTLLSSRLGSQSRSGTQQSISKCRVCTTKLFSNLALPHLPSLGDGVHDVATYVTDVPVLLVGEFGRFSFYTSVDPPPKNTPL